MKDNLDDRRWADDWYSTKFDEWNQHVWWCMKQGVKEKPLLIYLREQIESNLLHHKKTPHRNRRMRYIIVDMWPSLEACEIINELDLNDTVSK